MQLQARTVEPSFYVRSDRFVILISPDVLLERLKTNATGVAPASDLRTLVSSQLPLKTDVDLFKLSIVYGADFHGLNSLAADVIEAGKVSLRNLLPPGNTNHYDSIVEVFVRTKDFSGREFCTRGGIKLLTIVDEIVG